MDGILGSEKRNLQDPDLRKKADLARTLQALSVCLDFSRQGLLQHHRAVAFTAWEIGKVLGLQETELCDLYCAALIHDGGVRTTRERLELEQFDVRNPWDHCRRGREILRASPLLRRLGKIVFHHHDRWEGGNPSLLKKKEIPLASRIIHLADRIDVLRMRGVFVLHQAGEITRRIHKEAGKHFDPELVEAYSCLADREVFWLDLAAFLSPSGPLPFLSSRPAAGGDFSSLSLSDLDQLALFFARVIDEKSSFTYRHSRFVAELAAALAAKLGFSTGDSLKLHIAGLLHDLGKLAVEEEILEKPGPLSPREFAVIKQHPYFTYHILRDAGYQEISEWAAFHHEKLDGSGYPFHLTGSELSVPVRIMSLCDIYVALREPRPYRSGLDHESAVAILRKEAAARRIDCELAQVIHVTGGVLLEAAAARARAGVSSFR